jgi:lysozyme
MIKLPAKGITTKGIDVSHYDESIDFAALKAAGFVFVSCKCTEGVSVVDARYKTNKAKAKAAGLLFGAYHFFRPGLDPMKQAQHFLAHADIKPGDMIPMFDWEVTQGPGDVFKAKIFLGAIEAAIGKKMIIYGPPYMLEDFRLPKEFKDYPLWIADYGSPQGPRVPAPWTFWSFWQYTDKGSAPGIPAPDEDMDLFNGPASNALKFVV